MDTFTLSYNQTWFQTDFQVKLGDPPISLYGQLLWREFFFTVAANNPHFDRMATNPMCLQIPWRKSPERLQKWEEVCTPLNLDWLNVQSSQRFFVGLEEAVLLGVSHYIL